MIGKALYKESEQFEAGNSWSSYNSLLLSHFEIMSSSLDLAEGMLTVGF